MQATVNRWACVSSREADHLTLLKRGATSCTSRLSLSLAASVLLCSHRETALHEQSTLTPRVLRVIPSITSHPSPPKPPNAWTASTAERRPLAHRAFLHTGATDPIVRKPYASTLSPALEIIAYPLAGALLTLVFAPVARASEQHRRPAKDSHYCPSTCTAGPRQPSDGNGHAK